ncbi:hypothetical protein J2S43_008111 [Catenuloplanes nepalensis]|uniref:Uncharacterized protein n=1 Tax=Catenuloplanes nepalensis TaxID=587533 RepID=A0ABT9N7C5_9ACTN|nr:hypothetical protein [Catenuloplanes nepalensis]MDP9799599.1 hypothetical protein [Catenuloplanes nepalensis]
MPAHRMNRDEFFGKLASLDEQRLKTVLWTVYWRGAAPVRERIEAELEPAPSAATKRSATEAVLPHLVRAEVSRFTQMARAGSYIGGDRSVSPKKRSQWRMEFSRLAADARAGLRMPEPDDAAAALEEIIDLACETRYYEYFRSDDPMEAARFVVSDAVALLWGHRRDRFGFASFAAGAAPQLARWESRHGWTRQGFGATSQKEKSLAEVASGMLVIPDHWPVFARHYLDALDRLPTTGSHRSTQQYADYARSRRAGDLAEWHGLLLDRLADTEADDVLDRLTEHPALSGPELDLFRARLADRRGATEAAHTFIFAALERLPGHHDMLTFARDIGAPLPKAAQRVVTDRGLA